MCSLQIPPPQTHPELQRLNKIKTGELLPKSPNTLLFGLLGSKSPNSNACSCKYIKYN